MTKKLERQLEFEFINEIKSDKTSDKNNEDYPKRGIYTQKFVDDCGFTHRRKVIAFVADGYVHRALYKPTAAQRELQDYNQNHRR